MASLSIDVAVGVGGGGTVGVEVFGWVVVWRGGDTIFDEVGIDGGEVDVENFGYGRPLLPQSTLFS